MTLHNKSGLGRLVLWGFEITHNLTHTHTHTPSRSLLNQWPTRRRDRYLCNTQQIQEKNIHVLSRIPPATSTIKRLRAFALDRLINGRERIVLPFLIAKVNAGKCLNLRPDNYVLEKRNPWILPSSGSLRAVWSLETGVSVLPIGPIFKGQAKSWRWG